VGKRGLSRKGRRSVDARASELEDDWKRATLKGGL
jgi:hypothetical protein